MGQKALLIIDMLNDFVKEGGALVVPDTKGIIDNIKREINKAREEGYPVVYICDSHHPKDTEFERWPVHAVEGTWGAKVIDELTPSLDDYVIPKRRYSAFFGTSLGLTLKENQVNTLVLTGTVTNICVLATANDAAMRGYKIIVPQDCVAGLDPEMHRFALRQMKEVYNAEII